jgi:hypothetical protein
MFETFETRKDLVTKMKDILFFYSISYVTSAKAWSSTLFLLHVVLYLMDEITIKTPDPKRRLYCRLI